MTLEAQQILDTFSFSLPEDEETIPFADLKQRIINEVKMPPFFTSRKENRETYVIHVDASKGYLLITVNHKETGDPVGGTFGDIEKAYDYVTNTLKGDPEFRGDIPHIDPNAFEDSDGRYTMLSVPTERKSFSRALISSTKEDSEWLDKHDYYRFLKKTVKYETNPNDFITAFYWLNAHPAFWWRSREDQTYWIKEGNSKITVDIDKDDNGQVWVMLEHGSAVEPARTQHYHDLRLDIYAHTYEQAIIELAAKVHKFFHVDGSGREDVQYEKSQLELTLEERVKELEDLDVENS